MPEAFHHRSGTLKQTNKTFKSKHATKSSLKELAKGKVHRQSPKASSANNAAAQSKLNRRNHARQAQSVKRQALVSATRIFNGIDGVPRIVAVVPLTEDVNAREATAALADSLDISVDGLPEQGVWRMKAERFRTSLQFINLAYRDLYATLDACKVADYVVFVLSPSVEVTPWGDMLLRTLQAQGLPDVVSVIAPRYAIDPRARLGIARSLLSFMQYFVPEQARVFDLESGSDKLSALRALSEGKPKELRWREGRAWILGEQVEWQEGASEGQGSLKVTGVVRGAQLSPNRLVHLPNFGDFQISRIESAPSARHLKGHGATMDVEPALLAEPNEEDADSLVSSNDPDDMANEQTWPTEEEMQDASQKDDDEPSMPNAANGTTPKSIKKIPKGMSAYQAAWIVDDDEDDEENAEGTKEVDDGSDNMIEEEGEEPEEMVDFADIQEMESESRRSVAFQDLDVEEEERQLQDWRQRKREEQDDLEFPDEIDTPKDIPARTRFQRYRGLHSFRTSPWDPYENLPRDYGRIFQLEDFKRIERSVFKRSEEEGAGVSPGTRVTVFLKNCTKEMSHRDPGRPFIMLGLLQHEHKKSVLNFTVQRNTEYDGSVRSKDPLILCVGPRRLRINPIYSQHTRGGGKGANNVHKFERYLRHGNTTVLTTYGPLIFGNQPCALLRETADPQAPELVAMGSFMNPDTTRIVAKRIILSGHPFKVHKKTATVRYMFFNSDDVLYFKPIQLHTKHGRTGHIKESLGTHGYFKAHFDGPINQMDTVCMSLYKRVYPKWGELWRENKGLVSKESTDNQMEE